MPVNPELKEIIRRLGRKTRRGNFDKARFLRYGFLKAHEEHHDGKGYKTLICYDKQEHCFVRLKHDFVSFHGLFYFAGAAPLCDPVNDWLDNHYITFHWWLILPVILFGLVCYEYQRRNNAEQFERIEADDEVVDSNVNYFLFYAFVVIPFSIFVLWLVSDEFPRYDLGMAFVVSWVILMNTLYVCILIEGARVRFWYMKRGQNTKDDNKLL